MAEAETTAAVRRKVIDLLNDSLSGEYHSFIGHVLASNPYLATLERIRDEENDNTRALLIQLGRYRAGPTLRAFRWWKHDLNFLGLDFLVLQAADIAKAEVTRIGGLAAALPDDPELRATFQGVLAAKRRHADELVKLAATRGKERQARRAAAVSVTGIALKKPAPAAAAKPAGAAPAVGAPALPGAPKAPPLPGAPKMPSPPLPGAPKPPSPPLPGAPKPPSPPLPGGGPKPPSPPAAPAAPAAPAKPSHPPLPPGFKLPGPPKPPSA